MKVLINCKNCGARNRVDSSLTGKKAICGRCFSSFNKAETTSDNKDNISATTLSWIGILLICLFGWIAETARETKESTALSPRLSEVQSSDSMIENLNTATVKSTSSNYSPVSIKNDEENEGAELQGDGNSSRAMTSGNSYSPERVPENNDYLGGISSITPFNESDTATSVTSVTKRPETLSQSVTLSEHSVPAHGEITNYSDGKAIAPLEIRSSRGSYYLIRLYDYDSDRVKFSVFVHGGKSLYIDVPLGTYTIKYASGDKWYGSNNLFGAETQYFKTETSFDFRTEGNRVSGYTLTLYKVENGNLQTRPISPKDFGGK